MNFPARYCNGGRLPQIFDIIESETFLALLQTLGGLETGLGLNPKEEVER